jgi:N-acetylglutamate synthase-like GNAT family acetyltransferase
MAPFDAIDDECWGEAPAVGAGVSRVFTGTRSPGFRAEEEFHDADEMNAPTETTLRMIRMRFIELAVICLAALAAKCDNRSYLASRVF